MAEAVILLVESDILIRSPLAEYLRECGYRVLEAVNTDEAMRLLLRPDTPADMTVDIILADAQSEGSLDGFGLARWLREKALPAKIILAATIEKAAEKAGDLCEDGPLLEKPYHHELLVNRIRHTLALGQKNTPCKG